MEFLAERVQRSPRMNPAFKTLALAHLAYLCDARIVGLLPDPIVPAARFPKAPGAGKRKRA